MKFCLLCKYCGHRFDEWCYDESGLTLVQCPKCKDKNLKVVDKDRKDVFGYEKQAKPQ